MDTEMFFFLQYVKTETEQREEKKKKPIKTFCVSSNTIVVKSNVYEPKNLFQS